MGVSLFVAIERFPIAGRFVISRGAKTEAVVVTATLRDGAYEGRGECTPYARYGESPESVVAAIESVRGPIEAGADRFALAALLPAGAARNALDCALWDLEAKRSGVPAHISAGLPSLKALTTAYTLSVGSPKEMREAAEKAAQRPLLKIKLAGEGDDERLAAVRAGAPGGYADCRRQRGVAGTGFDEKSRRLRKGWRRSRRTAPARGRRRNAGENRASRADLRGRKRP